MNTMTNELKAGPANQSRPIRMMGVEIFVRISGEDSGGAYTLLEQRVSPGAGSPPHSIPQDKSFLVLEGEVDVLLGSETVRLTAGGSAFAPRGTRHCFRNPSEMPARIIVVTSPGGHEAFLSGLALAAAEGRDLKEAAASFGVAL
ncbi:MAG: cupin domain-containing protein [Acidobacteria bacterium]|nr:cupin domain-containing protein [Acidobacteriota bacterium]MCG3195315.1 hypothetical protein [Thermoanaerobaculia bacterium]MCK6682785.1 cupin domain-containing protein [Thermoanaerobaculia bacterium]